MTAPMGAGLGRDREAIPREISTGVLMGSSARAARSTPRIGSRSNSSSASLWVSDGRSTPAIKSRAATHRTYDQGHTRTTCRMKSCEDPASESRCAADAISLWESALAINAQQKQSDQADWMIQKSSG